MRNNYYILVLFSDYIHETCVTVYNFRKDFSYLLTLSLRELPLIGEVPPLRPCSTATCLRDLKESVIRRDRDNWGERSLKITFPNLCSYHDHRGGGVGFG